MKYIGLFVVFGMLILGCNNSKEKGEDSFFIGNIKTVNFDESNNKWKCN